MDSTPDSNFFFHRRTDKPFSVAIVFFDYALVLSIKYMKKVLSKFSVSFHNTVLLLQT